MPDPVDIESSAFSSVTYDEDSQLCVVIFKDGASYTYKIPQDVMDAWQGATSAGAFYNANIRGQHAFFVG